MPRSSRIAQGRRSDLPWQAVAAGAPVVFTSSWWLLGSATPGYAQAPDTISAVAAVGAPYATPMLAAFLVQGAGQLAGARLALRDPGARWVAGWLTLGGVGTILAGVLRLPDEGGPQWLATGHALAATAAFGGLHLAVLAGACSTRVPRWLRLAAAGALAVALPHLVWFLSDLPSGGGPWFGYAEKVFSTVLVVWCAALAIGRRRS
jgi:hypothetical protein